MRPLGLILLIVGVLGMLGGAAFFLWSYLYLAGAHGEEMGGIVLDPRNDDFWAAASPFLGGLVLILVGALLRRNSS